MRDERGEIVAVQGRAVVGNTIAAHVARGRKARGVYATGGLEGRVIAIAEAPIDALSVYACGISAVATGGTSFPAWLPGRLRMAKRVLIATDSDGPGDVFAATLRDAMGAAGINPGRIVRFRPVRKDVNADLMVDPEGLRGRLRAVSVADATGEA